MLDVFQLVAQRVDEELETILYHNEMKARTRMDIVKRGEWRIIRVDGTEIMQEGYPTIGAIERAIGAKMLDSVILDFGKKQVMMVDDTGMCDGRPINPKATKLYRSVCKPGTLHSIHGDVVIVNDADFA